jgi:pimeloyl-ACP methyl ester carboxylesterase
MTDPTQARSGTEMTDVEYTESADGTKIAYERTGAGPAIVLVGGAFNDRGTVRALADALAGHFTAYVYDRRGRGNSTDTPPYAVRREVEDLAAVIEATGGPAVVFGHSSGAVLALEAARAGLPITKVVAYEPPYGVRAGDRPSGLADRVRAAVEAGDRLEAVRLFLVEGIGVPAEVVEMMRGGPDFAGMLGIAHTLPYDLTITESDGVPRLADIRIPALLIDGDQSPADMRAGVERAAAAIPGAESLTMEGQDHAILRAPEPLVPVLQAFAG